MVIVVCHNSTIIFRNLAWSVRPRPEEVNDLWPKGDQFTRTEKRNKLFNYSKALIFIHKVRV
jgi:hypothetical protein